MPQIVGVKFKYTGKIYYFNPGELNLKVGQMVLAKTSRGIEIGKIVLSNRNLFDDKISMDLKDIIRVATQKDIEKFKKIKQREKKAFRIFNDKIKKYKLEMKLIGVEFLFDESKVIFYFTSDKRIDFRNLVKDLAAIFKIRIELRQVGVRDEARILGGIGSCGRALCCASFLKDFQPVSIKMAKEQGISLNPIKISGMCGRLMCCLNYEQKIYSDILKEMPRIGSYVKTPQGNGIVKDFNLLEKELEVQLDSNKDGVPLKIEAQNVEVINKKNNE